MAWRGWHADEVDVAPPRRAELGAPLLGAWLLDRGRSRQRSAAWRAFGGRLPGRLRERHGAAVGDGVRLIAAMLAGGDGAT